MFLLFEMTLNIIITEWQRKIILSVNLMAHFVYHFPVLLTSYVCVYFFPHFNMGEEHLKMNVTGRGKSWPGYQCRVVPENN